MKRLEKFQWMLHKQGNQTNGHCKQEPQCEDRIQSGLDEEKPLGIEKILFAA